MAEFLKQAGLDYGYFALDKPIHKAIANLDYGSELILRVRSDGQSGWEIADPNGVTVTRMEPPTGEIIVVQVAAIAVRQAKQGNCENLRCANWELVLPEIVYLSDKVAV